ncbi:MAG: hypothetical protein LBU42_09495 [Prevotellaceae bacterium]|jgi:hypothetical protein|nr:hypothetical protein [Prevotellaceae bacterium]
MKRIFKSFMVLSLGLAVLATGCKKDTEENYAKDISGTYIGTLSLAGTVVGQDVSINVAEKNKTTVTLGLNTTLPGLPVVGNLPLDVSCDATVAKSGDNYTINGSSTVNVLDGDKPITIAGPITSAGQADLTISITLVEGTPAISVAFSGTKK